MFKLFGGAGVQTGEETGNSRLQAMLESREIFEYHDGEKTRYGDPFAFWRALTQDPEINLERIAPEVDAGREPECSQFLALIRRVFDVKRFDGTTGSGLTDWQTLALLGHLRRFTVAVKKNSSSGPTLPTSTESASSTGQAPPEKTTSSSGDCTSMPAEAAAEKPTT